ncbi:T9SS type A sorting domain-containing protein [Flavobacterium microcysteis]|uniref:T9SS type A sorting domain-containing protein n=1 Tax=Flavobacterium microcysteis TaxID=2596891 RepID=A0A501PZA8_9FLAO|nr:hypothetical protein [Flavobacterium microcysteis]TPD65909.1 hypothetical protein FJA49_17165 [Flavobacterium microcysteis]
MRKLHSTYLLFILIFSSACGFARNHLSSVYKTADYDDAVNNINPFFPATELEYEAIPYAVAMANGQYSSLPFTITINVMLAIGNSQKVTFKYYQNVVKDYLNIRSLGTINAIEVYNSLGQLVKKQDSHSGEVLLFLEDLTDGTYVVSTLSESKNRQ